MAGVTSIVAATVAAASSAYGAYSSRKEAKEAEKDAKRAEGKRKKALSDELRAEAKDPTKSTSSGYGGTLGGGSSLGG